MTRSSVPLGPVLRALALVLLVASAGPARAGTSFRIDQVYSNLDGSIQYIQLRDQSAEVGPRDLGGLEIVSIRGGVTKSVTLPAGTIVQGGPGVPFLVSTFDLPPVCCTGPYGPPPPYDGSIPAGARVFDADSRLLPPRFLPLGPGTVALVGADAVSYAALPTAGHLAVDRTGATVRAHAESYALHTLPLPTVPRLTEVVPTEVTLREYRHRATGRYFRTANADEIEALETGAVAGWWQVPFTGVLVGSHAGTIDYAGVAPQVVTLAGSPACRVFLPPPVDAHFLSVSADECATVANSSPGAIRESAAAFVATGPDPATGACDENGPRPYPVHRLFDARNGIGHRYVADDTLLEPLLADGWVPEGYGPAGVAFCVSGDDYAEEVVPSTGVSRVNPVHPRVPVRGK